MKTREALLTLASYIEERVATELKDHVTATYFASLATPNCTTTQNMLRASALNLILSELMDELRWDAEAKLDCRQILALFAERENSRVMRQCRHKRSLN